MMKINCRKDQRKFLFPTSSHDEKPLDNKTQNHVRIFIQNTQLNFSETAAYFFLWYECFDAIPLTSSALQTGQHSRVRLG